MISVKTERASLTLKSTPDSAQAKACGGGMYSILASSERRWEADVSTQADMPSSGRSAALQVRDGVKDYILLMALSCHANGNFKRGFIPLTATTSFKIQR